MSFTIELENNNLKNNSTAIRNIIMSDTGSDTTSMRLKITNNHISDHATLIETISNQLPADSTELIHALQNELKQLQLECQANADDVEKLMASLNPQMSRKDIVNHIIKATNFLTQSTISGIVGNSAYNLLKTILSNYIAL